MSDNEFLILLCVAGLFAGQLLAIIAWCVFLGYQDRKTTADMREFYDNQLRVLKSGGMTYHE